MKKLIILFFVFSISIFPQNISITGFIFDQETNLPLPNTNIRVVSKQIGTISEKDGSFSITDEIDPLDTLLFSYVGYKSIKLPVDGFGNGQKIFMQRIVLPSQSVLVQAMLGEKGITPVTFEIIQRKDLLKDYSVQDIPNYLSRLPSTTFYSENGNGIGYNYLSIRGFDQRRISVSINGIPQNDPEDHNVYWLDFPDLLGSTELIQVQRGAGTGVIGYPAIGGSINIVTSPFSDRARFNLSGAYGSYNTRKYSVDFASGLVDEKYSIYAKLSQILSSGYRNSSWVKFNAYHISAVRYDKYLTTQLNFYGGPIEDGLAYTGLPKFAINDKDLRKENYSYWETSDNQYTYTVNRRPDEIENFSQPHFELLNEYDINNNVKFNSAAFLVLGTGFFDYDGSWSVFYDDYFRLNQNGFDSTFIPTNALIKAHVENRQFGWIPRISLDHKNGQLVLGAELRFHNSEHWGSISYAENLPPGVTKDYRYYFYQGSKNILNAFIHDTYNLSDQINLLGELQFAYHKYRLFNEKYVGNDFSVDGLFLNPRIGVNFKFNENLNIYISYANVTREPRLKNYYDAAESSAGETPQFKLNSDGTYNFNEPLVLPETMNDIEFGFSYNADNINVNINLFYMLFNDEIAKNGQVDRFGQPVTGNVDKTVHYGVEFSSVIKFLNIFEFFWNLTYSRNYISNGKYFVDQNNFIDLSNNSISGFPDFLTNFGIQYSSSNFFIRFIGSYVGEFYSDLFDNKIKTINDLYPGFLSYSDNVNEAYFRSDFYISYQLRLFNGMNDSKIYLQVDNVLDKLYSSYAIGKEFFPAAERSWLAGIQFGL